MKFVFKVVGTLINYINQLPLEWNIYLVFNSDIVNFVWKADEGE